MVRGAVIEFAEATTDVTPQQSAATRVLRACARAAARRSVLENARVCGHAVHNARSAQWRASEGDTRQQARGT